MSHCPGLFLEDWLTDWFGVVDADGKYGSGIRRLYSGQVILNKEQFADLVKHFEPIREHVENLLLEYDEDNYGSWRDYRNTNFVVPEDIERSASQYLDSLGELPLTKGLRG